LTTMTEELNLTDIPDLSALSGGSEGGSAWEDGWYAATILEERSFTDKNGNDRRFESGDAPSANGESRNIRLQVEVKRASDGLKLYTSALTNYRPEDLQSANVQAVIADNAKPQDEQDPNLTRARLTLTRLGKLQKIAGVRNFARSEDGGLDISAVYGKSCWVRLGADRRNPQYKEIKDLRPDKPTKAKTL
jgi:hypothetical protein